jgi:aspartate kinase
VRLSLRDGGADGFARLIGLLEEHGVAGKQVLFETDSGGDHASLVLSLENLHDFARLRDGSRAGIADGVEIDEQVGAVSAIGAGINAEGRNLRRALEALRAGDARVLALSTSSFRISLLLPEPQVADAVRRLHAALVLDEPLPA